MKGKYVTFFILGGCVGAALFFYSGTWIPVIHGEGESFETGTALFTGDIMLARTVERIMDVTGSVYPFEGMAHRIAAADIAVGNFESSVPAVHVPTPNFTFAFAAKAVHFRGLADTGFDALSLANNHALDYGEEGYIYTRSVCVEAGMHCFGHPTVVEPTTVVLEAGSTRVGLMGLHTLFVEPNIGEIVAALEELQMVSDVQIVYVHWGDEYELVHNASQEALAHALIDAGADAIIGHHPHVVQDIAVYEGKPIFYSLGNFVFDQYFSDEVQQGLVIEMHIDEHDIVYELVPISSIGTKSQPHIVTGKEAGKMIDAVFARSTGVETVREGHALRVPR